MCKLRPGARCAKDCLDDIRAAKAELKQAVQEAKDAVDNAGMSPSDSSPQSGESVFDKIKEAQDKLTLAWKEYDSTPTGQKKLESAIESAATDSKKQELQERLREAQERRSVQMYATRQQTAADRVVRTLPPAEQAELSELEANATRAEQRLHQFTENNRTLAAVHKRNLNNKDATHRQMSKARAAVDSLHSELAQVATKEYVKAGMDEQTAAHYARDMITSGARGWSYFGEDSTVREPKFVQPEFKVKGEDHPHHEAMATAQEGFVKNSRAQRVVRELQVATETHHHSVSNTQRALKRLRETEDRMAGVTERYRELKGDAEEARAGRSDFIAQRATGIHNQQSYGVTPQTFKSSTYLNPDGSTNAYILVQYSKKSQPYYAQVKGVEKKGDSAHIVLTNGDSVPASNLSQTRIRLLKPQDGATKAFS